MKKAERVGEITEVRPDDSGGAIRISFTNTEGAACTLDMLMPSAQHLVWGICMAAHAAARMHGDPATPPDGVETMPMLATSHVDASYGPHGEATIGIRFGRVALGASVSPEAAEALGKALQQLGTQTPGSKASH